MTNVVGERSDSNPLLSGDDAQRLRTLRNLEILDTEPDPAFDNLSRIAAETFETPIAYVSLVDKYRQWFKSKYGSQTSETSIESSFCAHTIRRHNVMVVLDATEDIRFREYPNVVGDPFIRFYAGAPIRTKNGQNIGALCIIDTVPRPRFTWYQEEILVCLANLVSNQIEVHRGKVDRLKHIQR